MSSPIDALADRVIKARGAKEAAETSLSEANKAVEDAELALSTEMGSMGLTSFKNALGSFTVSVRAFFSFPKEKKDDGMNLIKQAAPDLIKETVHPQTLSAWANEIERGDSPPPPMWGEIRGLLGKFEKPVISIRRTS